MLKRPMLFVGVLAAAFVVPYALMNKQGASTSATSQWDKWLGKETSGSGSDWSSAASEIPSLTEAAYVSPSVPLEQVFRFDVSPRWVTDTWPRVSTVLGEANALGLRVALISGTQADDVAGSLTYYFDDRHQVQRITLQGMTGDERRLVALLARQHGLQPGRTLGAANYSATDAQGRVSWLRVNHLPVVRAAATHNRAEVGVDLFRREGAAVIASSPAASEAAPRASNRPPRAW